MSDETPADPRVGCGRLVQGRGDGEGRAKRAHSRSTQGQGRLELGTSTRWFTRIGGVLLGCVVRLWLRTLRVRRLGPDFDQPGVIVFWHGEQFPLLTQRPRQHACAPISLSRDGRLQSQVMRLLGVKTINGSSSRGGLSAARGLLRSLKGGGICLIAVDGPRGPLHKVKPGALYLAQKAQVPIWCATACVSRGVRLARSWDRFLIPLPFSRTTVLISEPWHIGPDQDLESARRELQTRLETQTEALSRQGVEP